MKRLEHPTRRLGVIVPSSNTTVEVEFFLSLSESIRRQLLSLHFARIPLDGVTLTELEEMESRTEDAARSLASAGVDLTTYACTSGSLFKGLGHDAEVSRRISRATGTESLATATAVVETLRSLGISKASVGTPYVPEVDWREKRFLEENGIEVVNMKGLGLTNNREIGRLGPAEVFQFGCSFQSDQSQGIFLSCTNMPTLSVIEAVEGETGKLVVSSNSATLRAALNRLRLSREEVADLKIPGLSEKTELAL